MPPLPRNARLFVAFRILFNARFYYPVLAVLFVDLGLNLDQYALLNVAWAVSIVLFELPLGALGDQIGRKPLIVGAAALMVVEMAVLAFAPTSDPGLLFAVFLVNRVLSGLAEAAASGADEALAYDTMDDAGRRADWPRVLSRLQRRMAVAFVLSMVIGGAVYDPALMQSAADGLGLDVALDQATTARFPVYLTLLLSLGALAAAIGMKETGEPPAEGRAALGASLRGIAGAAGWIRRTRFALALILFSLVVDTSVRLFLTLTSTYYRLLDIPPALYGVVGAGIGALGFFAPSAAERLVGRRTAFANHVLLVVLVFGGLLGCATVHHWSGVLFVVPLALGMHFLNYFVSHYLNEVAESRQRATILSFKSLANNVAYGAAGWGFAFLMRRLAGGETPAPGSPEEEAIFARSIVYAPAALAILAAPLLLWSARLPRMRRKATDPR